MESIERSLQNLTLRDSGIDKEMVLTLLYGKTKRWKYQLESMPTPQPITLTRPLIQYLNHYFVAEKTDGVRYIYFCTGESSFLIDRRWNYIHIEFNPFYTTCLFDGELVDRTDGQSVLILHDIISYDNVYYGDSPFDERYSTLYGLFNGNDYDVQPGMLMRCKIFYPLNELSTILSSIRNHQFYETAGVSHGNDGLIFMANDTYFPKKKYSILKWKPVEFNTIDFLVTARNGNTVEIACQGQDKIIPFKIVEDEKMQVGTIYEFQYSSYDDSWIPLRERADKSTPNYIDTVINTLKTIIDNITIENIIALTSSRRRVYFGGDETVNWN